MPKIFISYRWDDSKWQVDALRKALIPYVVDPDKDVFVDVDSIPVGADFTDYIGEQVGKCDVLLAIIGSSWLHIKDKHGARRLDDPKDHVRVEIVSALEHGIPVAPVLIDDTHLPDAEDLPDDLQPLLRRNGVNLRRTSFESDVRSLVEGLGYKRAKKQRGRLVALLAAGVAALVVAVVAVVLMTSGKDGTSLRTAAAEPPPAGPVTGPSASGGAGRVVIDFGKFDTSSKPEGEFPAAPFLHDLDIPVHLESWRPNGSRVVIMNNFGFYGGRALKPTVSENFLTQRGVGQGDCGFTLRFGKPVAAVTFKLPAVFASSASGVTFPAWRVTALSSDGRELASASSALLALHRDEPARDYRLATPTADPIFFLLFESDFRRNGVPFAGFEAIVVEQLILEPMHW